MPDLPQPPQQSALETKSFLLLVAGVTLAFGWILLPFYGAVFWGAVLAIVFAPLYRRILARVGARPTLAALATLVLIVLLVILPLAMIASSLVQEISALYARVRDGQLDFTTYAHQIYAAMPEWLTQLMQRSGLDSFTGVQQRVVEALQQGGQRIAQRVLDIGQNTFDFVVSFFIMLYLLFFLLRDGARLSRRMREAIPLNAVYLRSLSSKFTTVIRATVKGNIAVAAVQGALGGLAFWALGVHAPVLWGVLMAFLSLLPAVGAGLVWGPVAIYLLATGAVAKGVGLAAYGVLVIGLVDNVLRPVLVGKDTKMPDYVVLISTLGGMALFGLNGFVIGPLVAAMFIAVWDIFATEQAQANALAEATAAPRAELPPSDAP
ncbi:AI-2E family transporter [Pseudorhodoferax sp.]|uniref:AI-2E family transporter n=1 Tax=Pseudorhodoferax sp. TaxID=1993553 RepID=UPI0039E5C142